MKLPSLEHPDRYTGLYVMDFGESCSVGYTAEEVAALLDSEPHADAKVYRIHGAHPDGTMELEGVPRARFERESGTLFYRRDLPAARRDYADLLAVAESAPPPCRASLFVGGFADERRLGFVVGLAFPAEREHDLARWLLDHNVQAGECTDGGIARLTAVRADVRIVDSAQLAPAPAMRARPLSELLARAGEPIQRIA